MKDPTICCLSETHFAYKDIHRLKAKGRKNIFHSNGSQKWGLVIVISDKSDLKFKIIQRDKEGHNILTKSMIQQEDTMVSNIYTPNTTSPRYTQQIVLNLKGEIDSNTMIVDDITTPFHQWQIIQTENQ